jgi:ATP-dependent Clp protease protease subunit
MSVKPLRSPQRKLEYLSRVITLGEIDNTNACEVIGLIHEVNREDRNKVSDNREPIILILNSPGGNVYDGMGIIDAIENSSTPVHIHIHGYAMSMGFAIATCGHYRYATKRSTFMYHECSWDTSLEKMGYHEQELKESKRLWELYDEIIVSNTGIELKQLQKVRKERKEWYIDAETALALGVVDEILK